MLESFGQAPARSRVIAAGIQIEIGIDPVFLGFGFRKQVSQELRHLPGNLGRTAAVGVVARDLNLIGHVGSFSVVCGNPTVAEAGVVTSGPGGGLA